jgi:hypothetical protein
MRDDIRMLREYFIEDDGIEDDGEEEEAPPTADR